MLSLHVQYSGKSMGKPPMEDMTVWDKEKPLMCPLFLMERCIYIMVYSNLSSVLAYMYLDMWILYYNCG